MLSESISFVIHIAIFPPFVFDLRHSSRLKAGDI